MSEEIDDCQLPIADWILEWTNHSLEAKSVTGERPLVVPVGNRQLAIRRSVSRT
jgi:hypothetical protein